MYVPSSFPIIVFNKTGLPRFDEYPGSTAYHAAYRFPGLNLKFLTVNGGDRIFWQRGDRFTETLPGKDWKMSFQ